MEKHYLIKELRELNIRKGEIEGELRAFLKKRAERLREFKDGEKVGIYSENDRFIGEGFVHGATIFGFESFDIKKFSKSEEAYLTHINDIRYRVLGIKKDGTPSSRNATSSATISANKNKWSNYIKKI